MPAWLIVLVVLTSVGLFMHLFYCAVEGEIPFSFVPRYWRDYKRIQKRKENEKIANGPKTFSYRIEQENDDTYFTYLLVNGRLWQEVMGPHMWAGVSGRSFKKKSTNFDEAISAGIEMVNFATKYYAKPKIVVADSSKLK